jgi:sigma-B regulation protein RsbU (phosphoserine phosphatase)
LHLNAVMRGGFMATQFAGEIRSQLIIRRHSLERAASNAPEDSNLSSLLREVDAALLRLDSGTYGLCETCHEAIESERLAADPLVRFCIDHLSPSQQRALEQDLELAARIQSALLPPKDIHHGSWRADYHFEPAGPVSGDYCDLIPTQDGGLYFMLGDVSGKGIAAAMLMSHLHALFRALISVNLPLTQIVERASRVFCESTHANQYATLVCGRADARGNIEICNAGHLPSLVLQASGCRCIDSNGLPLGLFCSEQFSVDQLTMTKGDSLMLLTDGLSEAQDPSGAEFGLQSLIEVANKHPHQSAQELVRLAVKTAMKFCAGALPKDDLTLLVIERSD